MPDVADNPGARLRPIQPYLPFGTDGYRERASRVPGVGIVYSFGTGDKGANTRAVPDGCTDLSFGIGPSDIEIVIGGTVTSASDWRFDPDRTWVGCRFAPAAAILPHGLAPADIVGRDLKLDSAAYGGDLEGALCGARSDGERAAAVEAALARRAAAAAGEGAAPSMGEASLERYVRNRVLATDGAITVGMLARETGVSERYLRRVFSSIHGISPKQFACFVRFQRLLGMIESASAGASVKDMALACGYYDQSHLVHEFKRFSGVTPERYRRLIEQGGADPAAQDQKG
mgnify:CR=1 FL=1